MLHPLWLVGPAEPMRRTSAQLGTALPNASLRALEVCSRTDARLEAAGVVLEGRTTIGHRGSQCAYCGSGLYHVPQSGCPACTTRPSTTHQLAREDWLQLRAEAMRNGIEYSCGGSVLSVK